MKLRLFFNRHIISAVIFCSLIIFIWSGPWTHFRSQPKLFNQNDFQFTPEFFRLTSVGFWPAAVDALWISTLQSIGSAHYSEESFQSAREFYRLATTLDPNFYELYEQGGVLFSFYYHQPLEAKALLERGIHHFELGATPPHFWKFAPTLYILLASTEAFDLNDWPSAKEVYLKAAALPGAPPYLLKMKQWLQKENSEKILAKKVLHTLILNTDDQTMRASYQEKLKQYE